MKYEVKFTTQFKKDLKRAKKQHKNLDKLFEVVSILANGEKKLHNTRTRDAQKTTHPKRMHEPFKKGIRHFRSPQV